MLSYAEEFFLLIVVAKNVGHSKSRVGNVDKARKKCFGKMGLSREN